METIKLTDEDKAVLKKYREKAMALVAEMNKDELEPALAVMITGELFSSTVISVSGNLVGVMEVFETTKSMSLDKAVELGLE